MKAVAYCRYSTDNQTENSIAYQLNAIQKYCETHRFSLLNVYADEAMTGTNSNREGLQRMLADSRRHAFDVVVIYDQSRLSRNILDWFSVREQLRTDKVKLCSCTEQLDDSENGGVGFLSEGVRALFNHQYVLDTRAKTIAGQTTRAKQGAFLGGTPPLGYDIKDGKYVVNEPEARAVKMIFDLYASGKSYGYIVDQLKEMGIKSKRGATIGNNALYAILRNERYIGVYTWNKTKEKYLQKWAGGEKNPNCIRIESGIIPPIIDRSVWEVVEKRTSSNKQNAKNTAKREYLLSGLVHCGKCGAAMVGIATTSKKGYTTRYYTCTGKRRLHNCDAKNVNADELEVLVVGQVERDILNETIIERIADDIIAAAKGNSGDDSKIRKELAESEKGIQNLLNAIQNGLDAELAFERINALKVKRDTLRLQLDQFLLEIPERENILKVLRHDVRALKENRAENLKAIMHKYISAITVTEEQIIIDCLGDMLPKQKERPLEKTNDLTMNGCGAGFEPTTFGL